MARLFADENFSFPVVEILRSLGHDVLTVNQIGKGNQGWPDEDVFLFCVTQSRVLLTKNRRDFYKLHLGFRTHPGISRAPKIRISPALRNASMQY